MLDIPGYKHISFVVDTTITTMDKTRSGLIKPLFTSSKAERNVTRGLIPSDQMVIAARTGCGKSAKIIQDMTDYADGTINPHYINKLIILYDSWEMPGFKSILRMVSRVGEIEARALLDYERLLTEERYNSLKQIALRFKGMPIYVSTRPTSAKQWEENKKQIQGKYPTHHIMNIFDHTRMVTKANQESEGETITELMLAGVRLKNEFDMFNIFLSQLNRNIETKVARDDMGMYLPQSSDIFASDAVFQCADIVMAMHRPGMYRISEFEGYPTGYNENDPNKEDDLLVECYLKNRDGKTGNIMMKHNLAHNKIWDYPTHEQQLKQQIPKSFSNSSLEL